ncbi:MAG: tRNA (adenosine(37)-N6)-threonylcarbamoyltransferase complex dimerization subunit type 1 TsaB [Flavobacteriales bacterium]
MPLILAIETATKLCSVAVARDGMVLALREEESERHTHAERINVFIEQVMQEGGVALRDLDAIAVGIGPGSYTGLRIGLSAAKGLCYALDKPLMGLGTLGTLVEAAATHVNVGGERWPMIDARRMEVFTQAHDVQGQPIAQVTPLVLDEAWATDADGRTVFGDGADKAVALWAGRSGITFLPGIRPHAAAMFAEAERRFAAGRFDDLAYLVPEYGKAANVTQPKKRA